MLIAITGATGFVGRYLINALLADGHQLRCWYRSESSRAGIRSADDVQWVQGELADPQSSRSLVDGCDCLVHAALWKPGNRFQGAEGDIVEFAEKNVIGSLRLFRDAFDAGVRRVVYVSSCAVHDEILTDRPLDETHPVWPKSHYGAHKGAVEAFVSSYGRGESREICALRPTGIYGIDHPPESSKWFNLIRDVVAGKSVQCRGGGKEVHVGDVADAIKLLLTADGVAGEVYACYDQYISHRGVADLAKEISGSDASIQGEATKPKNQIDASKIKKLGMKFRGDAALRETIAELVEQTAKASAR